MCIYNVYICMYGSPTYCIYKYTYTEMYIYITKVRNYTYKIISISLSAHNNLATAYLLLLLANVYTIYIIISCYCVTCTDVHFTYIIFMLLFIVHRVNHLKAKRYKHANCYVLVTSTQDNYK